MPQQSMIPSALNEGGGSDPVGSSRQRSAPCFRNSQYRQLLACISASLTMLIVGTINGWTTTALLYQISATGDVLLRLTRDEYTGIVSLTVLSSMIGSLMGVELADRFGRKRCLLICFAFFIIGWIMIYAGVSVRGLHYVRVIHGIGIGIARTINPMYVSEVADISIREIPGILIAVNVYIGSLLTCILGYFVTHDSLLQILIVLSFMCFMLNMYFPETPYFLMSKGKNNKARESIAYFEDITDPGTSNIELRELREQTRYESHQQSRSDLPLQLRRVLLSQTSSDLPSQSRSSSSLSSTQYFASQSGSDLPSPSRSDLPSQSRSDLPSQSRSDLPSQSRRNLPPQSLQELDTEPMSDLYLPSSSDSPSISITHSEVLCDVHQQPTRELRLQASRDSHEIPLQPSRTLHSQPTSELHRPSTSEIHGPSASQIHRPLTSQIHRPSTSQIHGPSTSQIHGPSTSQIHGPSTSQIHGPSTSQIHGPSTSQIRGPSTSRIHGPSTSQIHGPSTSQIHGPSSSELRSQPRSDLRRQYNVDSHALADVDEIHMDVPKYTWLTKLQVVLEGSNRIALLIMLGLVMTQQLSGNFFTMQYLEQWFLKSEIVTHPYYGMLLIQAVIFTSSVVTIYTVPYFGRRTLVLLSTAGLFLTLCVLIGYLYLIARKFGLSVYDYVLPIDLVLYQIMFQIGLGTIPNILLYELFPTELTGFVAAITVIFDAIISFAVTELYVVVTDNVGLYLIYIIFATACYFAFGMLFVWMPETKEKTYNEIEEFLVGTNTNSSNEGVRVDRRNVYTL